MRRSALRRRPSHGSPPCARAGRCSWGRWRWGCCFTSPVRIGRSAPTTSSRSLTPARTESPCTTPRDIPTPGCRALRSWPPGAATRSGTAPAGSPCGPTLRRVADRTEHDAVRDLLPLAYRWARGDRGSSGGTGMAELRDLAGRAEAGLGNPAVPVLQNFSLRLGARRRADAATELAAWPEVADILDAQARALGRAQYAAVREDGTQLAERFSPGRRSARRARARTLPSRLRAEPCHTCRSAATAGSRFLSVPTGTIRGMPVAAARTVPTPRWCRTPVCR